MKTIFIVFSLCATSAFAQSNPDLGQKISFAAVQDGKLAFGVQYTYGNDPDGLNYMATFTPLVPMAERTKLAQWNYYSVREKKFLLPIDPKRVVPMSAVQISVQGPIVESILKDQGSAPTEEIDFVYMDADTAAPLYYFSISEMCLTHPTYFADLTNGRRCDQATTP